MHPLSSHLVLPAAVAVLSLGTAAYAGDCCSTSKSTILAGDTTFIAADAPTTAPATSAEEILQQYEAVQIPEFDPTRRDDQGYIRQYIEQRNNALDKKATLARQFVLSHPGHDRAAEMAIASVQMRLNPLTAEQVRQDIAEMLALPELSEQAKQTLAFLNAQALLLDRNSNAEAVLAEVEQLKEQYPDDERIAALLYQAAETSQGEQKIALLRQVTEQFPDSRYARYAEGKLKQTDAIGKPFELAFEDAVTGKQISVQEDLKGKVVVVDFWATWCGPCIAEMPHMKSLYTTFQPQGVEFIGVSLDQPEAQGGKQKLLEYVEQNNIPWPQYYQGNGWQSEFSSSWGINSIPALFVIDADGKLHSTNARGQLEEMLPRLIAQRNGKTAQTASGEVSQ